MLQTGRCDDCQVPLYLGRPHICGGPQDAQDIARQAANAEAAYLGLAEPVLVHWHPELPGREWTTVQVKSLHQLELWWLRCRRGTAMRVEWIGHELSDGTWDVTKHHSFDAPWTGPGLLRVVFLENRQAARLEVTPATPDNRSTRW